MANRDTPTGFRVGYTKHGGPAQINAYKTDGVASIFAGDVLDMTAGRVATVAATSDLPMGVAASFTDSTSEDTTVLVYDDLANTIFIVQADTSQIAGTSFCGVGYDLTIGAGSTLTGRSAHELDASATCIGYLHVIDKVPRPDNAWGAYVDLYVQFLSSARAMVLAQPSS
jgi:hypothetical protein